MSEPITTEMPKVPDYLSFVDEDIKEMFEGKGGYLSTDILMAQLIKELRKSIENKQHE